MDEAYSLSMDLDVPSIHIKSITPTGVFYGIQSIISILSTKKMPKKLEILDGPRYTYRYVLSTRPTHSLRSNMSFFNNIKY